MFHRKGFTATCLRRTTHSGVMWLNSKTSMADITDGSSNTFLVGEAHCYPDDPLQRPASCEPGMPCFIGKLWCFQNRITTYYGINSHTTYIQGGVEADHPGGAQFVFADGHVNFISQNIKQEILKALTTRAGVGPEEVNPGAMY